MKIQIVNSQPNNGQEEITPYVGSIYETLELKKYYDTDTRNEMKQLEEVAIFLAPEHRQPSILNKGEYIVIEG